MEQYNMTASNTTETGINAVNDRLEHDKPSVTVWGGFQKTVFNIGGGAPIAARVEGLIYVAETKYTEAAAYALIMCDGLLRVRTLNKPRPDESADAVFRRSTYSVWEDDYDLMCGDFMEFTKLYK